jgi:hypothetical protein
MNTGIKGGIGYASVDLDLVEQGWLMQGVWAKARDGDQIARRLYVKLKEAAIACGVDWYYGDPWTEKPPT